MNESNPVTKDPICGMPVDEATAIHAERDGKTFYFCSDDCRQKFLSTPAGTKPEDAVDKNTHTILSSARLNPIRLGLGFSATGVVFYLGCMLTMATVPREKVVLIFNSLLHGLDIEPILRTGVPVGEVVLGLVTTFILGWFVGVLIAGFYNLTLRTWK